MASTLRRKICGAGTLLGIAPLAGIATGASAQSRPETLKVGVALALSGPTAPLGQAALQGLKLAVEQYQEAGGFEVAGRKFLPELLVNDTGGSPANGVAQAEKLVLKEGVKLIFGCTYSPAAVPMLAVTQRNKVIQISNAVSWEEHLGKPGNDYMFKLVASQDDTARQYIPLVVKKLAIRSATMILPNNDGGRAYEATYRSYGEKNGVKMLETFFYDPKLSDFYPILTKIKGLNPDSLWIGYTNESASVIVRQAKELNLPASLVALGTGITGVAANLPGGGRAEGFVFATQFNPESSNAGQADLMRRFEKMFAKKVTSDFNYVLWYNQGLHLLVDAMKKTGTVGDTTKIMAAVRNSDYEGAYGYPWHVDKTGLNHYGYYLGEVKGGRDTYTLIR
ncbi:MAG: ABC transporter substrate-binding protein [Rubrivivax sp.]